MTVFMMRIQKYLAECGVCSRRAAEDLVRAGKVIVNGSPAVIGMSVDEENDHIVCEGRRIHLKAADKQYFLFYKPRGVITAMKAQDDRSIVGDLIKGIKGRVYPVGRLDRESEGLLLLTDNGELAQRLCHPSHHIPKTYRVTIKGTVSEDALKAMRKGIEIEEDVTTLPAGVYIQGEENGKTVLHITLFEGRNREIRKICEELGLDILLLKRIAIGDVLLGHLQPGEYRPLTNSEICRLHEQVGLNPPVFKKTNEKTAEIKSALLKYRKAEKSEHERRFEKQLRADIKKSTKNKKKKIN